MYEYTRTYEGLGRQAYTRHYGGLGRQAYTRNYGGLGWVYSPGTPDQFPVGGRNVCFSSSEESFAAAQGCRPAYGMGCRQPDGTVSRYPCCPSDESKTLWECPQGRPGTGAGTASPLPAGTSDATRDQIRALQTAINASGCSAGTVDGIWGPNTAQGLQCYIGRVGAASVARNFPWATARAGGTPEVGKNGGGGAPAPANGGAAPAVTQAGVFPFAMPGILGEWWFWAAVVGIGGLGVAGYLQYKKNKEEEEFARIGGM